MKTAENSKQSRHYILNIKIMETVNATQEHKLQLPLSEMVQLPAAQYAHPGSETEWWWHIGTLVEESTGRQFGFEINAGELYLAGLIQVCLTDVKNNKHYQTFKTLLPCPSGYAESNPANPWFVKLESSEGGSTSTVHMTAPQTDPTNMKVKASFSSEGTDIAFDLQLNQQGNPLLEWGTGYHNVYPHQPNPLQAYNFYYSLTHLKASGTITLGGSTFNVTGTTWMDHEFGAFPKSTKWMLQDLQLSNGVSISSTVVTQAPFQNGVSVDGKATVLLADGTSIFINTNVTPSDPFEIDDYTYYQTFDVQVKSAEHGINALFKVKTAVQNQIFKAPNDSIYEGIGTMESGTYNGDTVTGTVWIEQNVYPNLEIPKK